MPTARRPTKSTMESSKTNTKIKSDGHHLTPESQDSAGDENSENGFPELRNTAANLRLSTNAQDIPDSDLLDTPSLPKAQPKSPNSPTGSARKKQSSKGSILVPLPATSYALLPEQNLARDQASSREGTGEQENGNRRGISTTPELNAADEMANAHGEQLDRIESKGETSEKFQASTTKRPPSI
ncbi:hypothetical protein HII31_11509 [Pseudocercospora fuligena]|uniref:Uncharacterized protein n=1 Tax=Pseudocercospora fuligena TaxID=685502 RepID=A0A8H6R9U0_9PEZI|nr:hypothetical protein HII31_11509 [Pseudocercospora fuligena]